MRAVAGFVAALIICLAGCASPSGKNQIGASSNGVNIDHKKRDEVVMTALSLLNTRYKYGGSSPSTGFDCSGLVAYVFAKAASQRLPHNTVAIARQSRPIGKHQLSAGDLVFFNTLNRSLSHVGIYLGNGDFINAPSSGGAVRVDNLSSAYFAQRFEGASTLFNR
ncbi:MAG TPA: C40 family peptidase [Eoetvoesiella sp.]